MFRSYGKREGLAVALNFELQRFAAGAADEIHELIPVGDFLAVDGEYSVAGAESGAICGRAGSDFTDAGRNWVVAERTRSGIVFEREIHGAGDTIVFHLDVERGTRSEMRSEGLHLFPSGIFQVVDGKDVIAILKRIGGGGLLRWRRGDDDGLVEKRSVGNAGDQIIGAKKNYGKDEIDGGAGEGDEGALPAGLGHEFIGGAGGLLVTGIDFGEVLTGHADVAAERDSAEAPIGLAPLEAEEARTEADGEDVDANAKEAGDDEMSPLVNEDDDAENENYTDCSVHAEANPFRDIL